MKVERLETHDRLKHFVKDQSLNVAKGANDCLFNNPLSLALQQYSPYVYLFAHPRTADDGVTKVMYWQPRLTKPEAQTNSYLFRAKSRSDIIEVCWLLPPVEMWPQYQKGNVTEHETVNWSIGQFKHHKQALEAPDKDDLSDDQIKIIYEAVKLEKDAKMNKIPNFQMI